MKAKLHVKLNDGKAFEKEIAFTMQSLYGLDLHYIRLLEVKQIIIKTLDEKDNNENTH